VTKVPSLRLRQHPSSRRIKHVSLHFRDHRSAAEACVLEDSLSLRTIHSRRSQVVQQRDTGEFHDGLISPS